MKHTRAYKLFVLGLTFALSSSLLSLAAPPQRIPRNKKPIVDPKLFDGGNPPRHIGDYPAFKIIWQPDARIRDVTGVFPHPLIARRAVLTTSSAVLISDDAGKNWKELPGTTPAQIGAIRHVAFALSSPDTFYFASKDKGVWQFTDLSKPPVQVASKANGLLSDAVSQVRIDTADPLHKTLIAVHGADAGGISRSLDAGRTWAAVPGLNDYFIEKLYPGGPGVPWAFAMASLKDPTAPNSIYFCHTIGDFLKEYASDAQAADGAVEILFHRPFPEVNDLSFWATGTSGILKTDHDGTNAERLGPEESKWSSVGVTWGPTADTRIIYGYSPQKLGFVVSQDDGKTFTSFSDGLPTGRFVKQGAHVRANAGGSMFFATINGSLYIGRRYTGPIGITDLHVTPASLTYAQNHYITAFNEFRNQLEDFRNPRTSPTEARDMLAKVQALKKHVSEMSFAVTAKITSAPEDTADAPAASQPSKSDAPASITVDLSRVGGSPTAPMFDDGAHGDGAPNDGIYGATCLFRPDRMRNIHQDIRRPTPGPMALTITAMSQDGAPSSAIAVIGFIERPESHVYWAPTARERWNNVEGGITVAIEEPKSPADRRAIKVTTTDKPWALPLTSYYDQSALGFHALSFYVKTDSPTPPELFVHLKDFSPDTVAATTVRVPVLKEKLVEGGTLNQDYHRVVIPFSLLLKDPPAGTPRFRPSMLRSVVISGDAAAAHHLWITPIRFHADAEDLKNEPKGTAE